MAERSAGHAFADTRGGPEIDGPSDVGEVDPEPFGRIVFVSRANRPRPLTGSPLQPELAVPTPQPVELLALRRRQSVAAAAGDAIGLGNPVISSANTKCLR